MEEIKEYDVVIIGSGPAGESAAMQAIKLRKTVALIEKSKTIGGASLHTGSVPSKSLRETVVHLEILKRGTHGVNIDMNKDITVDELTYRKEMVIDEQESGFRRNIRKTGIDLIHGSPVLELINPPKSSKKTKDKKATEVAKDTNAARYQIRIAKNDGGHLEIRARNVVIATGSRPYRPPWAATDGEYVFDSDTILKMKYLPRKLTVIGAGVIGCEYSCIFARLGIRVNLVSSDYNILGFLDHEITDRLKERMREQRIALRFGEEVQDIKKMGSGQVCVYLKSGKCLNSSHVLVATGRNANSDGLGLEDVGVNIGKRGRIDVDSHTYETSAPGIYAVGDVIGFPGLSSTSMQQGRVAMLHAFNELQNEKVTDYFPFGIWTIPPVAMVGKTEKELTEAQIPYEIGIAHFREVVRAKIMGEDRGILKLLFDPGTLKLLGVHIIGPRATELIHLGHSVMYYDGDIKFFTNTVFNYPTLDESYRIAAFNGLNRLSFDL